MMTSRFKGVAFMFLVATVAMAEVPEAILKQAWYPKAPPLPTPAGQVIRVSSVDDIYRAAKNLQAGSTILVADGHYMMTHTLGLNPKKLGKMANNDQEPWKEPLPDYIETLHRKHFKKDRPDNIRSIEQMVSDNKRKKESFAGELRRVRPGFYAFACQFEILCLNCPYG